MSKSIDITTRLLIIYFNSILNAFILTQDCFCLTSGFLCEPFVGIKTSILRFKEQLAAVEGLTRRSSVTNCVSFVVRNIYVILNGMHFNSSLQMSNDDSLLRQSPKRIT